MQRSFFIGFPPFVVVQLLAFSLSHHTISPEKVSMEDSGNCAGLKIDFPFFSILLPSWIRNAYKWMQADTQPA